jgi:hypothetical protein
LGKLLRSAVPKREKKIKKKIKVKEREREEIINYLMENSGGSGLLPNWGGFDRSTSGKARL